MVAASFDNLIFLVLIAVAALFQLLSKAISKSGKNRPKEPSSPPEPQTIQPVQRAPGESDADRIRKFLEALGQPPGSSPPPPVLPRSDVPVRPLAPVQPPPVIIPGRFGLPQESRRRAEVAREERRSPETVRRFPKTIPPPVPVPATLTFEVHRGLATGLDEPASVAAPVETYGSQKVSPIVKGTGVQLDIASLLASKATLRQVIVLRELLGSPRGLQIIDGTP
jgi:hypothetical protein